MTPVPLVSIVLAARDAAPFLDAASRSILGQTVRDLELVVVDDGSKDETPALLAALDDPRVVVLRNEEPTGLASALNLGFERARARYVARMDADDVALPRRLELQLARLWRGQGLAVVGTSVAELDSDDRVGAVHLLPSGVAATRWRSLFGTPFFHPSVVVDRAILESHGLRYDAGYDAGDASTEDFELWSRLLDVADGDNLAEPLLLYRRHAGQASARRAEHQLGLRRKIAATRILAVASTLEPERADLAWLVGDARAVPAGREVDAVDAYLELLSAFGASRDPAVRRLAARDIARVALRAEAGHAALLRTALAIDPLVAARVVTRRAARRVAAKSVRLDAEIVLRGLCVATRPKGEPTRVVVVAPEPTPYRSPLFDRVGARAEIDLTVVYAAATVADRRWSVEPEHRATVLHGVSLPLVQRLLHHDYPVTPGVLWVLREVDPDVVVVTGWSTFASQAAIMWCRRHTVPYLLLVSSHDASPKPGWRRAVKGAVVPRIVRGAVGALVLGTLSRRSLVALGARPETVRVFANTVDAEEWGERADALRERRQALRSEFGAGVDDVVVLSVARLAPEKGLDDLIRAAAAVRDPRLLVVVAGHGPERAALEGLAAEFAVRLRLVGEVPWERMVELYVAADLFALLSSQEAWGVVVNEAAACGLPLVLSDQVGAAYDLLQDGENGALVASGDVAAASAAIAVLVRDPSMRVAQGVRSREVMREWGYGPSVESFVAAVRDAIASR
jgi:glycosyltransferase involved in cell wall biosynthesis